MFGASPAPQDENTTLLPQSPYAVAKVMAYHNANNYREAYGMYVANGILFNHESPRRGANFVTRKITMSLANILAGKQKIIQLGNLAAKRDWGFAPEYVEVMWTMLQQDKADNYVIGTGQMYSVEEFLKEAFSYANLSYKKHIEIDSRYMRPLEVDTLCADSSKAKDCFGFDAKVKFKELVKIMVDADMERIGLKPIGEGNKILKNKGFDWIKKP
jgi:GDPmannose 4,6-dehydratase